MSCVRCVPFSCPNTVLNATDPTGNVTVLEVFQAIARVGIRITFFLANRIFDVGIVQFLFVEVGAFYLLISNALSGYNRLARASGKPELPNLPRIPFFPNVHPNVRERAAEIYETTQRTLEP